VSNLPDLVAAVPVPSLPPTPNPEPSQRYDSRPHQPTRKIDLLQERDKRDSPIIRVCKATKDEWRAYLGSDNQALKSKCCAWIEGSIYIVEFPLRQERERFSRGIETALVRQPAFAAYMLTHGSAVIPDHPELPDYEPNNSYGPRSKLRASFPPGDDLVLPRGRGGIFARLGARARVAILEGSAVGQIPRSAVRSVREGTGSFGECLVQTVHGAVKPLESTANNRHKCRACGWTSHGGVVRLARAAGLDLGAPIPPDPVSGEQFPEQTVEIDLFAILEHVREDIA
jgi:hypothetical protein